MNTSTTSPESMLPFLTKPPNGFACSIFLRYTETRALVSNFVRRVRAYSIPGCLTSPPGWKRHAIWIAVQHQIAIAVKAGYLRRARTRIDRRIEKLAYAQGMSTQMMLRCSTPLRKLRSK